MGLVGRLHSHPRAQAKRTALELSKAEAFVSHRRVCEVEAELTVLREEGKASASLLQQMEASASEIPSLVKEAEARLGSRSSKGC